MDHLVLIGLTRCGALEFRPDNSVIIRQDYVNFDWKENKYWIVRLCGR